MKSPRVSLLVSLLAALAIAAQPLSMGAVAATTSGASAFRKDKPKEPPPEPRCFPPYVGESIPAQKILKDLSDGKNVDLQGRIIDGNLDADLVWPAADERKTTYRVVPGRLRLDSCRITGRFAFPRTVFLGDVMLTCTEVLGELDLSDVEIRGGLDLGYARVLGETRLTNAWVGGDTSLKSATCEDRLDFSGVRLRALSLGGGEFRRDVEVGRAIIGSLDLSGARLASLHIGDVLVLSSLSARETSFSRGLTVSSARILGSIELPGAVVSGGLSLSDVIVSGNLVIPLSCEGPASLADVGVGKNLVMVDGSFKDVTMSRVRVEGSAELDGVRFHGRVTLQDTDFGKRFDASAAVFEGDTEFRNVRFPGEDPMAGALFASAPTLIDTTLPRPPTLLSESKNEDAAEEDTNGADEEEPDTEGDEKGDSHP